MAMTGHARWSTLHKTLRSRPSHLEDADLDGQTLLLLLLFAPAQLPCGAKHLVNLGEQSHHLSISHTHHSSCLEHDEAS